MKEHEEGNEMNLLKKIIAIAGCFVILATAVPACADDGFRSSYTYNFDYWGDYQHSPDAYRVETVIGSTTLGLEELDNVPIRRPQALYARDPYLYVCDTGNNRILEIKKSKNEYKLIRCISEISGTPVTTFNTPTDVFVDEQHNFYVADSANARIVMFDKNLNWIRDYTKPQDSTFDQNSDFIPQKIVVDVAGRVYCIAKNINKGLAKYEADGSFSGFIGANQVSISMGDYIWKRYFMSKTQREQSESFVPTEYENICIDEDGFIYATNTSFAEGDLKWDKAKPIRRLNSLGNDILIKNDRYPPIGELYWVDGNLANGPSKLADITVLENDIYVAVDRFRGRIFGYDAQGIMLWAFGTKGHIDGTFTYANSIEHIDRDLYVLDQTEGTVTVFVPTEYGNLIYDAQALYLNGDYTSSAEKWQDTLKMNANYPMAFRGIGRAILREDRYEEAMDYFKLAHDRENYGRAFKLYRKEWIEKNILWIILILVALLTIPLVIGRVKKMKWEVNMHEYSKVRK